MRLPFTHSVWFQRLLWRWRDWSGRGEEWTVSPEWKRSLIEEVLRPRVPPGGTVLEIGPGAGRWSEALREIAGKLVLVDLSPRCIEMCRTRFAGSDNIEYFVGDGRTLSFLGDATIDFVWSFDTFVHMNPADIASYLNECGRVLRPGGGGIIHHAATGGTRGGWRTDMTSGRFAELLAASGLEVVRQFDAWGGEGHDVRTHGDALTLFGKSG